MQFRISAEKGPFEGLRICTVSQRSDHRLVTVCSELLPIDLNFSHVFVSRVLVVLQRAEVCVHQLPITCGPGGPTPPGSAAWIQLGAKVDQRRVRRRGDETSGGRVDLVPGCSERRCVYRKSGLQ